MRVCVCACRGTRGRGPWRTMGAFAQNFFCVPEEHTMNAGRTLYSVPPLGSTLSTHTPALISREMSWCRVYEYATGVSEKRRTEEDPMVERRFSASAPFRQRKPSARCVSVAAVISVFAMKHQKTCNHMAGRKNPIRKEMKETTRHTDIVGGERESDRAFFLHAVTCLFACLGRRSAWKGCAP